MQFFDVTAMSLRSTARNLAIPSIASFSSAGKLRELTCL
jgi:hypothetical protein